MEECNLTHVSDTECSVQIVPPDPLPLWTWSKSNVKDLKSWLRECSQKHDCRTPGPKCLPTRLVQFGDDGHGVKLVETNGETGRYLTLSHCWGDYQPITTT